MTNRTALITGASGGIGADLARIFAREGWSLVLVARNADKLAEVAKACRALGSPETVVIPCDLGRPGAPARLFSETELRGLHLAALVNNAGFGERSDFAVQDPQLIGDMISLNVTALTQLTRLVLPGMLARGGGRILNVASTAAFQPGPYMAVYYATKAFVLSLSEALHEELRGTGVTVTALCPGPTHTGFADRAGMGSTLLFRLAMQSSAVAETGYGAMMAGRALAVAGWRNWLLVQSNRISPRSVVRRIVASLQKGEH